MSFSMRPGHPSDLPYVYEICHLTGYRGQSAEGRIEDRFMLGHYFSAPYLIHNPDWSWILTRDEVPVGYLVATPDTPSYNSWFNSYWLPSLRALYAWIPQEVGVFEAVIRRMIREDADFPDFLKNFPAHFHIDLLPEAQGRGYGTLLIKAFLEKLYCEKVVGFHLGVAPENLRALRFYQGFSWKEIQREPGVIYLGLKTETKGWKQNGVV